MVAGLKTIYEFKSLSNRGLSLFPMLICKLKFIVVCWIPCKRVTCVTCAQFRKEYKHNNLLSTFCIFICICTHLFHCCPTCTLTHFTKFYNYTCYTQVTRRNYIRSNLLWQVPTLSFAKQINLAKRYFLPNSFYEIGPKMLDTKYRRWK